MSFLSVCVHVARCVVLFCVPCIAFVSEARSARYVLAQCGEMRVRYLYDCYIRNISTAGDIWSRAVAKVCAASD